MSESLQNESLQTTKSWEKKHDRKEKRDEDFLGRGVALIKKTVVSLRKIAT